MDNGHREPRTGPLLAALSLPLLALSTIDFVRGAHDMQAAVSGVGEPTQAAIDAAAGPIGQALTFIAVGLALGIVGATLALVARFGCRYRTKWFLWGATICLPLGTIVGLIGLAISAPRSPDRAGPRGAG